MGKIERKLPMKELMLDEHELTFVDYIEIEVPSLKQRVRVTITKTHTYDPEKCKIVKDQVVHRARYCLNTVKKNDRKGDKEGSYAY